ncbi:MAG: hypothetical protein AAFR61_11555 [Bacteroidota bacterium]
MAIAKKGSRNITVDGIAYRYKVSKIKKKSGWREQVDELDETFMKYARYYGLGEVRDITLNIVAHLEENPASHLFVKIQTVLVDGFLGPEQLTQIKPQMVARLIRQGLADGWKPAEKGDARLLLLETQDQQKKPVLLQFPDDGQTIEDYQPLDQVVRVEVEEEDET